MPDNPRGPGHPSDMPSSRPSEGSSNASSPQYNFNMPSTPPPAATGNNQTRNVIIGAIATIISATAVYYLTQYVNRNKGGSTDSFTERKEATSSAWSSYVAIDNLYLKNIVSLVNDEKLRAKPDEYMAEIFNEMDKFVKDAENLSKKKNIDESMVSLLNRRVEREKESKAFISSHVEKVKAVNNSSLRGDEKSVKWAELAEDYADYTNVLLKRAANELEDLSKVLSERYGKQLFSLDDFVLYSTYKKVLAEMKADTTQHAKPDNFAKNINPKTLIGNWSDKANMITLLGNKKMSYSLQTGEKDTGSWRIEDDRLRLDAVDLETREKSIWLFNLRQITPTSFTMVLSVKPFYTYNMVRVK